MCNFQDVWKWDSSFGDQDHDFDVNNRSAGTDYHNFPDYEPNNSNGVESCVEMYPEEGGRWNDINCGDVLPFVCQGGRPSLVSVLSIVADPPFFCKCAYFIFHGRICMILTNGVSVLAVCLLAFSLLRFRTLLSCCVRVLLFTYCCGYLLISDVALFFSFSFFLQFLARFFFFF